MVPSCSVRELYQLRRNREFSRFAYGLLRGCLDTRVPVVRIELLEYSKINEKVDKFIVCEFGGFQNVLRDACVRAIPTYIESLPTL